MDSQEKYTPFTMLENSIADKIIQDLSLSHLGFYYILRSYSDGNYKPVFPSYEILQKRTNKSKIQIKRIEKDLVEKKFIKIDKKYKKTNIYSFVNLFDTTQTGNVIKNDNIIKNDNNLKENLSKMIKIPINVIKNDKGNLSKMTKIIPDLVNTEALNGERNQIKFNHIYNKEPDSISFSSNTNFKKEDKKMENINDIIKQMGLIASDGSPTVLNKKTPNPVEKKENILSDDKIKREWVTKKAYRYYDQYVKKVSKFNELSDNYSNEEIFSVLSYLDFGTGMMYPKNPADFNQGKFDNTLRKILMNFDKNEEFQDWYQNQLNQLKKEKEKMKKINKESQEDSLRWQKEEEFDKWRKTLSDEKRKILNEQGIAGRAALMEYYFRMKKAGG